MIFPVAGAEIVGGEHAGKAITVLQPAQIGGSGQDIVAAIEGIFPQPVLVSHLVIGAGHQLHHALGAGMADNGLVAGQDGAAAGFIAHHGTQQQQAAE